MNDQASTLRMMTSATMTVNPSRKEFVPKSSRMRCIAVTGGKGGVGKSNLTVNLALELGALGRRVALLDADFGLANADLLCGITPQFHLGHVLAGLKDLDEIIVEMAENVGLIPGGSGVEELANFSFISRPYFFEQFQKMEADYDFMLIDTAAGIAENVLGVLISANEVIVIVTPDPTSIVDAYATIKVILRHAPDKPVSVVVNNVIGVGEAEQVFQPISSAVRCFLNREIEFLGMIPQDARVREAVREQVPVVNYAPDSPASRAIRLIARQLHQQKQSAGNSQKFQSFWEMLAKTDENN